MRLATIFSVVAVLAAALSAAVGAVEIEASGPILSARGESGKLWMVVEESDGPDRRCGLYLADGTGTAIPDRVSDTACTSVLSRLEPAGGAEAVVVVAADEGLVFAYWKGLRKARLAIDVYLGTGRSWQKKPRSTGLSFSEAERWFLDLEHDFDGDGLADLVVLADDRVQVFSRNISASGKNILAEDPMWMSAPLMKGDEQPMVISAGGEGVASEQRQDCVVTFDDIDGDGRVEILLTSERTLTVHRPSASPAH